MTPKQKAGAWGLALSSVALVTSIGIYEGTEFVPYKDIVGVWTVCDGVTGKHVIPGKVYTRAECRALTGGEIERHGLGLLECVDKRITQPQYEALASWTYNVGIGAACRSTLVKLINAGQPAATFCREIMKWNVAGGKPVQGLTNRRRAELAQCLS